MEPRYTRNIGTITEEEQNRLGESRVFLAGCGGLGGNLLALLLRIGIGHITAIDGDAFDETNLNRQLLCSTETLGQSKALTAKQLGEKVNPLVELNTRQIRLNEENCDDLIRGHDLVVDALDNIESRFVLAESCDRLGIPMVYGAIRGWTAQTGIFLPGTALQRIRMLYPQKAALKDKSCLAFTPAVCASLEAAEAVKYLLRREGCLVDRLLYLDLLGSEMEEIPF